MHFEPASRKRRRAALTPLIDVVFLLLVFFMLATSFDTQASLPLRVGAPAAPLHLGGEAKPEAIRIALSADGQIRVNGGVVRENELSAALERALADDRERPVRVLSDGDSQLQAIATVLAELERVGAKDVGLVLQTPVELGE